MITNQVLYRLTNGAHCRLLLDLAWVEHVELATSSTRPKEYNR